MRQSASTTERGAMIWMIGLSLAGLVGVSMGLLGGGGAVLAVPILVYIMGVPVKSAVAMTLVIIGTISLFGAIYHGLVGNLNVNKALKFGLAMLPGAFLGAKLATLPFMSDGLQMGLLATVMLIAAFLMIVRGYTAPLTEDATLEAYPKPICKHCGLWMMTEGLGVGILTGLIGIGGGFAIVPALVLLGDTPIKEAIPTSLFVIALSSMGGLMGYWGHVTLDWNLIAWFTAITTLGLIVGIAWAKFFAARQLQKLFGFFLIAVAAVIFSQARG
ncbi:MAG: sulfite exporter TauE/SafE family protein [Gammaproteobacteria bacterium]